MKKESGRPHKLPFGVRKLIAEQVTSSRMSYREAGRKYGCSSGAVGTCVREFKAGGVKATNPPKWVDEEKTQREIALELENQVLKTEIGELYMQMKLLKKVEDYKQWLKNEVSSVITSENLDQFKKGVR